MDYQLSKGFHIYSWTCLQKGTARRLATPYHKSCTLWNPPAKHELDVIQSWLFSTLNTNIHKIHEQGQGFNMKIEYYCCLLLMRICEDKLSSFSTREKVCSNIYSMLLMSADPTINTCDCWYTLRDILAMMCGITGIEILYACVHWQKVSLALDKVLNLLFTNLLTDPPYINARSSKVSLPMTAIFFYRVVWQLKWEHDEETYWQV